jgi:hypothetical protein
MKYEENELRHVKLVGWITDFARDRKGKTFGKREVPHTVALGCALDLRKIPPIIL